VFCSNKYFGFKSELFSKIIVLLSMGERGLPLFLKKRESKNIMVFISQALKYFDFKYSNKNILIYQTEP
jgi:hypothetical protein